MSVKITMPKVVSFKFPVWNPITEKYNDFQIESNETTWSVIVHDGTEIELKEGA